MNVRHAYLFAGGRVTVETEALFEELLSIVTDLAEGQEPLTHEGACSICHEFQHDVTCPYRRAVELMKTDRIP